MSRVRQLYMDVFPRVKKLLLILTLSMHTECTMTFTCDVDTDLDSTAPNYLGPQWPQVYTVKMPKGIGNSAQDMGVILYNSDTYNFRLAMADPQGNLFGYADGVPAVHHSLGYAGDKIYFNQFSTTVFNIYQYTQSSTAPYPVVLTPLTSGNVLRVQTRGPIRDFPRTNYIYLASPSNSAEFFKIDMTTGTQALISRTVLPNCFTAYNGDDLMNDVLLWNTGCEKFFVRMKSTLGAIAYPSLISGRSPMVIRYDYLNDHIHTVNSNKLLACYDKAGIATVAPPVKANYSFTNQAMDHIVLVDMYRYLVWTSIYTPIVLLVSSVDYSFVLQNMKPTQSVAQFSMVDAFCYPDVLPDYTCRLLHTSAGHQYSNTNSFYYLVAGESRASPAVCIGVVAHCLSYTSVDCICGMCEVGYGLDTGGICVDLSTLTGRGLDPATGWVAPCTDLGCLRCPSPNTVCTACPTIPSPGVQTYVYNSGCTPITQLPPGIGINTTSPDYLSAPCIDTNCTICLNDYTSCMTCKSIPVQYYLFNGVCYPLNGFPDGIGYSSADLMPVPCLDTHCRNCSISHSSCVTCLSPETPQYYIYNTNCLLPSQLPAGIGANSLYLAGIPCSDNACELCNENNNVCTKCKSLSPTVFLYNGQCPLLSSIPDGLGVNVTSQTIANCTDSHCKNCKLDITICTSCFGPTTPQYVLSGISCVLTNDLPPRTGANLTAYISEPCFDPNCNNCSANYLTCTDCIHPASPQYYLYQSSCTLLNSIGPSLGINTAAYSIVPCLDPNCVGCLSDYTQCFACISPATPQYYLYTDSCVLPTTALPPGFGLTQRV